MSEQVDTSATPDADDAINGWGRVTDELGLPWNATASRVLECIRSVAAERDAARAEVERQASEIASLRLTLGGRTYSADVPEPVGCPVPGACVQVAEIQRLRADIERRKVAWSNVMGAIAVADAHERDKRQEEDRRND